MKKILCVLLTVLSFGAYANSLGLALPSTPGSYGQDSIRAGDLDCKNAIGGATQLELGVTGIIENATGPFDSEDPNNPQTKDVGVYARIIIPLDGPKERINCNSLYQLELRKKRMEVLRLQEEIDALKRINSEFEN